MCGICSGRFEYGLVTTFKIVTKSKDIVCSRKCEQESNQRFEAHMKGAV